MVLVSCKQVGIGTRDICSIMSLMTVHGLQTGFSSHEVRFIEMLELLSTAIGYFPRFDNTDLPRERFMMLYLKLVWNYRDLMVLYFVMRALHWEHDRCIFNNVRFAMYLLYYMVHGMSNAMVERGDFTEHEQRAMLFDSSMHVEQDEMSYLYTQYTVWLDFMYDIFRDGTRAKMMETMTGLNNTDKSNMANARGRLEDLQSLLWAYPHPVFHLSPPVNFERAVLPRVRAECEAQMQALEGRLMIEGDGQVSSQITDVGFPRMLAPWNDAKVLVARPKRVPPGLGERV